MAAGWSKLDRNPHLVIAVNHKDDRIGILKQNCQDSIPVRQSGNNTGNSIDFKVREIC